MVYIGVDVALRRLQYIVVLDENLLVIAAAGQREVGAARVESCGVRCGEDLSAKEWQLSAHPPADDVVKPAQCRALPEVGV